jgi:hypothetical protein
MSRIAQFGHSAVVTVMLLAGCSHSSKMSQEDVVRLANRAAADAGYKLTDYKAPEARYEFTKKDKTWSVFFDGKAPMPGNHFLVCVDDKTGKTQVMPGE